MLRLFPMAPLAPSSRRAAARLPWLQPLLLSALIALMPLTLAACSAESGSRPLGCSSSPVPCLQGRAVVELETSKGPVRLTIDGDNAPLTAGNFVDLVRRGVYNGTVFHRVVRDPKPFVVQGGDPSSADPKVPVANYGMGNFVDPTTGESRFIPLELKFSRPEELRYGTQITAAARTRDLALTHQLGAVAMARSSDPNSASAQFYIALEALPELDGRYAVFGRVSSGMEVVKAIEQGDRIVRARLLEGGQSGKNKE